MLSNVQHTSELEGWLVKYRHNSKARLRIFYFPYAGGSASVFAGMETNFPGDVDVFSIQAPGREQRFHEEPISCLDTYVSLVFESIKPYLDIPTIFIGYSNGCLIAYEVARKLQRSHVVTPIHLVLAARRPPHLPRMRPTMHDMSYEDLLCELRRYSRAPEEFLRDKKAMSVFIPMLRADFALGELKPIEVTPKLTVNATVFWGRKDEDCAREDMQRWSELIDGEIAFVGFSGGHFFCHDEVDQYVVELERIVEKERQNILKIS